MEDYKFKLDAFEGPMDLLMHLIEKNKIDIYDIPIAELTRQYLDYLDKFREFNMEIASSFLVMAATLLQIKSRMMLPKTKQEETAEEEDPHRAERDDANGDGPEGYDAGGYAAEAEETNSQGAKPGD